LGLLPNGARIHAAILINFLEQGFIQYNTGQVRAEPWCMADACPLYFAMTFINCARNILKK
jgi:hypothetical protein